MILTTEQQKQIEFAKTYEEKTGSFPKAELWVMRNIAFELDNGEEVYFPFSWHQITETWVSYNNFRKACGAPILRHNSIEPVTLAVLEENCVKEKRSMDTHCWIWQDKTNDDNYPQKGINGKKWTLHRYVLIELKKKPDPSTPETKYTADHLCRVRDCINPDHLRWATGVQQNKNRKLQKFGKRNPRPPLGHKTLTERVQWWDNKGQELKDKKGCIKLPLIVARGAQRFGFGSYIDKNGKKKYPKYTAHVAIYLLHRDGEVTPESYGAFIDDFFIRHTCAEETNHACNNYEHLEELPRTTEGFSENARDAISYRRNSKVQHEQVREIRKLYKDPKIIKDFPTKMKRYAHIGSLFNLADTTVLKIISGARHPHVK